MKRPTVTALTEAYTLVRVVLDRRTPHRKSVILIGVLTVAYVLSPVDLLSDVVPVVGWSDDLLLGLVGRRAIYQFVPPEIVEEHRTEARSHLLLAGVLTLFVVAAVVLIVLRSIGVV